MPASRPRVSRWGTYYGKKHQAFRSAASACLEQLREQGHLPEAPLSGRLSVVLVFEIPRPKTTKRELPNGDVDNYAKLVLDCCTGFLWDDDTQIELLSCRKAWAKDAPGIHVWFKEIQDGRPERQQVREP